MIPLNENARAWIRGYDAFSEGVPITDAPTDFTEDWRAGWEQARKDSA